MHHHVNTILWEGGGVYFQVICEHCLTAQCIMYTGNLCTLCYIIILELKERNAYTVVIFDSLLQNRFSACKSL